MNWKHLVTISFMVVFLAGCTTSGGPVRPSKKDRDLAAADANYQLGLNYWQQGRTDLALEKLKRSLEQNKNHSFAHVTIALVYESIGDQDLADKHWRQAIRANPRDPDTQVNYGIFLCKNKKDYRKAEEFFMKAAKNTSYRTPWNAYSNAGICVKLIPDLEQAEIYFRTALSFQPRFPDALAQMALLSFEDENFLGARAFIERHDQSAGLTAAMLWLAVQVEMKLGDKLIARDYGDRIRREFPEAPEMQLMAEKKWDE